MGCSVDGYCMEQGPGSNTGLYTVKHASLCFSYLLLHNKLPPNLAASLGGSGSEYLIGCSQDAAQGCSHLKAWLGLKGSLPIRLTHVAVGGRHSFFAAWAFLWHTATGFSQREWSKRENKEKTPKPFMISPRDREQHTVTSAIIYSLEFGP